MSRKKSLSSTPAVTATGETSHALVPGVAFEVQDPTTRLIHMLGGGLWNEPRYYDPARPAHLAMAELLSTGAIRSNPTDASGLNTQAQELLRAALEVARGEQPKDLLVLALWARTELQLRTTPQVLLAVAAHEVKTKPFVRAYVPRIVQRADELRQVFAAYLSLFGHGVGGNHTGQKLPNSLKRGLADAFGRFSEAQLLKYDSEQRPTFKDVLRMVDRAENRGLPRAVARWFTHGELSDPAAVPTIAARRELARRTEFDAEAQRLAKVSHANWEVLVSQFGSQPAVWEWLVDNRCLGYMAMLRNLRNLEKVGVSAATWTKVEQTLAGRSDHRQLPFRFLAALREVSTDRAKQAVGAAFDRSVVNLPELPGRTFVIADNSGSCTGGRISTASKMSIADAGNTLMALLARRLGPQRCTVGVFGDRFAEVKFTADSTALELQAEIERCARGAPGVEYLGASEGAGVGGGTETGLWWALDAVTKQKAHYDRIILLSDLCCYTQGDINCSIKMSRWFSRDCSIEGMLNRYRQAANAEVFVHSINLSGHGQAQTNPHGGRTQLLSGWSENVFQLVLGFEGAPTDVLAAVASNDTADGELEMQTPQRPAVVPTVVQLRERFG